MASLSDPLTDIYSPQNIARSRERAEAIRTRFAKGELDACCMETADAINADATEREMEAWLRKHPSAVAAMPSWATEVDVETRPEWVTEDATAFLIFRHRYDDGAAIEQSADYLLDGTVRFNDPGCVVVTLPDDDTPLKAALATVRDIRERTERAREIEVSAGIYLHESVDLAEKIIALVRGEGFDGFDRPGVITSTVPLVSRRRQSLVDQLRLDRSPIEAEQ